MLVHGILLLTIPDSHLMVLVQRSRYITPLEIVFWLWSSGFMIDELVDIGESGISLYLMSLWNTFDVGIFLLFVAYVEYFSVRCLAFPANF